MMENNLIDVIGQYNIEAKSIQGYIPTADIKEIYIVDGLKKLLTAKSDIDATKAIIETNRYFQDAVGFEPSHRLFDAEKLKALVKKYAVAAIKQKQMSSEELLAQMRDYQSLVMKQESEKKELTDQTFLLNNVLETTLQSGVNSASITAKSTKKRFEKAIQLLKDPSFQALHGTQQAIILNDVVVAGESAESAFKRQLFNMQNEKE